MLGGAAELGGAAGWRGGGGVARRRRGPELGDAARAPPRPSSFPHPARRLAPRPLEAGARIERRSARPAWPQRERGCGAEQGRWVGRPLSLPAQLPHARAGGLRSPGMQAVAARPAGSRAARRPAAYGNGPGGVRAMTPACRPRALRPPGAR